MKVSLVQYFGSLPQESSYPCPVHDVEKVGFDVAYMFIPARIYNSVSHLTQLIQLITTSFPVLGRIRPDTGTDYTAPEPTGISPRLGWGSGDWLSKFSSLLEAAELEERQSVRRDPISLGV